MTSDINKFCYKAELFLEENLQSQFDNMYLEKAKGEFILSKAKNKIQKLLINGVTIENEDQVNEEIEFFL